MSFHLQFIFHWQHLSRWHVSVGVIAMAPSIILKAANSQISFTHISHISRGKEKKVFYNMITRESCKHHLVQMRLDAAGISSLLWGDWKEFQWNPLDRLDRIGKDSESRSCGIYLWKQIEEVGTSHTVWLNDGSGPNWIKWHSCKVFTMS